MIRAVSVLLTSAVFAFACGGDGVGRDGDLVGGPCASAGDCEDRCLEGGDYPGGLCTVSCNTDEDCPPGTHCIDEEGGTCFMGCEFPEDCRVGYTCKGEENRGHGGDSLVCAKD